MVRGGDVECRGDLVARAQRGPLSAADSAALRAHLASCGSCRATQQVAADFAAMRAVDRGDAGRLERMSALARRAARGRGQPARPARRRKGLRAATLAAGVILVAGSASAAVWLLPRLARKAQDRHAPASLPALAGGSRPPGRAAPAEQPVMPTPTATPAPLPTPEAPALALREHAQPRSTRERARTHGSAAVLLHEARAAESAGRGEEAVALYRRLQREFAGSSEALVAAVPLGRLLLERSSPRSALGEFDRYLGAARGGVLVPEALYGRAQALARLGDREEQQRTWRRLVADFPDSPYSAVARRRLSELK